MKIAALLLIALFAVLRCDYARGKNPPKKYDVVIYGGTAAGVMAAYTAARLGKSVLLIEPGIRIGGLTTGGLGYTDIGNKYAIKGLSLDFYRRVGRHYGAFEQWIFEPHVAEDILKSYLARAKVPVWYSYRITSTKKQGARIVSIAVENALHPHLGTIRVVCGREFIDCSYEGDLMAKAGVSYTVGREDNKQYGETYDGSQLREKHQFPDGVDPYKVPGHPESGLLWGISSDKLLPDGTGNKMEQTYNIRVCLSRDTANSIPIIQPDDYRPERYELLLRLLEKKPVRHIRDIMTVSEMPNQKTDINNNGPFSTDMIGMSWGYPDGSYAERAAIFKAHVNYTKGFFYFIGHDPRVPQYLRDEMLQYGYPKDEYKTSGHFTTQMYVREARRMAGEYVMTQVNCQGKETVNDGIALAAYTMDSHNAERLVVNGMVKNEGDVQIGGFGPYPIAYRSITPKAAECGNLVVPVCLSASHIAYGSIRMEPVFMMLGQSAATAACMAIDGRSPVQSIDVKKLQQELIQNPLADGSTPEILILNDDTGHVGMSGNWLRKTNVGGCYGPSLLVDSVPAAGDHVRFSPRIKKQGGYEVYTYVVKAPKIASSIQLNVNNGVTQKDTTLNMSAISVKGQTEGEWVAVGKYHFVPGKDAWVDISPKTMDGAVLADAVLFVPVRQ